MRTISADRIIQSAPSDFFAGVQASELEPLVGGTGTDTIDGTVPEGDEREEDLSDLKISFRSDRQPGGGVGRVSRVKGQREKRNEKENREFGISALGGNIVDKRGSEKSIYDDPRSV